MQKEIYIVGGLVSEDYMNFKNRISNRLKRWKFSPMDLESRSRWLEYSKAKDEMFAYTDIKQAPWYVVNSDVKKHARLNCISHLLSMIPYEDLGKQKKIVLEKRTQSKGYK